MLDQHALRFHKRLLWLLACLVLVMPLPPIGRLSLPVARPVQAAAISPVIVSSFTVPGNRPSGLAWGNGSLWMVDVDRNLYQLDPSGAVQATMPITVSATELSWFENSLWAHDGNRVYQLDATGHISSTLDIGYWAYGALEWAEGDLYVTDYNFSSVHKHNRAGQHLLSWQTSFFGHPTGMAYDGTGLWIGDSCEGYNDLYHYSLLGDQLDVIDLNSLGLTCDWRQNTRALAWDGHYLWYTADDLFKIYRLDIAPPPLPQLTDITPGFANSNSENLAISIFGTHFRAPVAARLENIELNNVTLVDSTLLNAVVPVSSLSQGVYDLTISSAGQSVTLTNAFIVKPASIPPSPPDEKWNSIGLDQSIGSANTVGSVVVDPNNSDVIYAADTNGSSGDQLHRSINRGLSWDVFRDDDSAQTLAIDPTNSGTMYVSGYLASIYKTIDGGTSWNATGCCIVGNGTIEAIAVDPNNPTTLYAGVSLIATNTPGVYKSINGGATWSNVLGTVSINSLTVDPTNARTIYATGIDTFDIFSNNLVAHGGVYKSVNAGLTWTQVFTRTQANAVVVDPTHPQVLYVATEDAGVYKSLDGGLNWIRANTGLSGLIVRGLALDRSNPQVLYAGLWEGGVFRSLDGGASWSPINTGLSSTSIRALAIDPSAPNILYAGTTHGIFQWIGSPPIDPYLPYAHVTNPAGNAVAGALIYLNGAPVVDLQGNMQRTNTAGNLVLPALHAGDTLVALVQQQQRATSRQAHDGWAYQVFTSSQTVQPDSSVSAFTVSATTGPQALIVRPTNPLILFNLVVSIEWEADSDYLAEISSAMQQASDYLYDVTDGQMAFGQVTIFDHAENWTNADIQISTSNMVRPHSYIGGLTSNDVSHVLRIGRAWDGNSGNQGRWDRPDGYRTIAHEFGHYALYLYDSYFGFMRDAQGHYTADEAAAFCTGATNRNAATDATNATVMDYQYTSSELSMRNVPGLWSSACEMTAQWQMNQQSDWETLVHKYRDTLNPARWTFVTPQSRGGVLAGPTQLARNQLNLPLLVFPSGSSAPRRQLSAIRPDGTPERGAIVALYRSNGQVIGQGQTDTRGILEIYGAGIGDVVRVLSFDGGLAGKVSVDTTNNLRVTLAPVRGTLDIQSATTIPHLRVFAEPSGIAGQTNLLVGIVGVGAGADPAIVVSPPDSPTGLLGATPPLGYSPSTDTYQGQISFSATERGTGGIHAVIGGASVLRLQSTYRLQHVTNDQADDLFSDDGNLSLHLDAGSLPGQDAYLVVMSPGALPGPLPAGLELVGDAYDVTGSGALSAFERPVRLELRYDRAQVNTSAAPPNPSLYRWDPTTYSWSMMPGFTRDDEHKTLVGPVTALGIYALLAPAGEWTTREPYRIALPLIRR